MKSIQLSKADEHHLKQLNKIETLLSLLKGTYNQWQLELEVLQAI